MQTDKLIFHEPGDGRDVWRDGDDAAGDGGALSSDEMGRAAAVWRQKSVGERARILKQFQKVLIDSLDEITAVINQDCGKTRQDALIEVFITVDTLHQYCKHAAAWLRGKSVWPGLYFFKRYYTEQRPYGAVAVIGPWNYPLCAGLRSGFGGAGGGQHRRH
jgi:acyl-CoA reductase-like NAD-dependent aldehyde dehydrogenase